MITTYPQPREGIVGTARDEPWLALTDDMVAARDQLITSAFHLYRMTLFGSRVPIVGELWERMSRPRPGDLVAEVTRALSVHSSADDRLRGFGILLAARTEWASTDDEWTAQLAEAPDLSDDDRCTDKVFYLQYGPAPADVCSWRNAEIIAIPTERDRGQPW